MGRSPGAVAPAPAPGLAPAAGASAAAWRPSAATGRRSTPRSSAAGASWASGASWTTAASTWPPCSSAATRRAPAAFSCPTSRPSSKREPRCSHSGCPKAGKGVGRAHTQCEAARRSARIGSRAWFPGRRPSKQLQNSYRQARSYA